jgi:hypothetical protein
LKSSELDYLEENAAHEDAEFLLSLKSTLFTIKHSSFSCPSLIGEGYDGVNGRLEGVEEA